MVKSPLKCKFCSKLWTNECPIRVWGRNELNYGQGLDVNPDKDFCSRFKKMSSRKQKIIWRINYMISEAIKMKRDGIVNGTI